LHFEQCEDKIYIKKSIHEEIKDFMEKYSEFFHFNQIVVLVCEKSMGTEFLATRCARKLLGEKKKREMSQVERHVIKGNNLLFRCIVYMSTDVNVINFF